MPVKTAFEILKESIPTVNVGVLPADLLNLGRDVEMLEEVGVKVIHFDVMDGCFCPQMTVGPPFIKAVKTSMLKDAHLMIDEPIDKLGSFVAAGSDMITAHVESTIHIHRVFQALGKMENVNDPKRGLIRCVALNPGTLLEMLRPLLDEVDVISLIAVNPGWGGQKFIESTWNRIEEAKEMIGDNERDIILQVDGGITKENIGDVAAAGADIISAGSAVFDGKDPEGNARYMLDIVKSAAVEGDMI